jgi:dienelactone hydrolase
MTTDTTEDRQTATDRENEDETATAESDLSIEAPARSPFDEQISVQITGAQPGDTIEFTASLTDPDGCAWRSSATFRADENGAVDLTAQAPESGSYEGVAPMGWLWSMSPDDEDQMVTRLMNPEPKAVTLRAETADETTTQEITRVVAGDIESTAVDRDGFVGNIYEPATAGPHPGVLVLHGSGGSPVDLTAALLARHGFSAFALRYIGDEETLPDRIRRIPLSYFDRATRWFQSRDAVVDEGIGIVGHSRGAEVGLALGARCAWAGSVVSYAGSSARWDTPMDDPAWLGLDGDPLPSVSGQGKPTLCEGQLDEADEQTRRDATTALEDIDGSVLFLSGGQDPIWPAQRLADYGMDRLDRVGGDHDGEHRHYEDGGHFITPPHLPKNHHMFNGTPAGMARADAESWPAVLDCLSE